MKLVLNPGSLIVIPGVIYQSIIHVDGTYSFCAQILETNIDRITFLLQMITLVCWSGSNSFNEF